MLAIRVAFKDLDGKSEADARAHSTPLSATTGANGGLLALMFVLTAIKARIAC